MLDNLFKITKFIPYIIEETVYDIDFNKLYEQGKRFILFDLDNTLLPYDVPLAHEKLRNLLNSLRIMGFKIMIVSNNSSERVNKFCEDVNMICITRAKKPFKNGFKKAMKLLGCFNKKQVVSVGDQVMTDVLGSNRTKIDCILVKPLKKSNEKWYTKLNRKMEKHVLKRIKKYDESIYKELEEKHEY